MMISSLLLRVLYVKEEVHDVAVLNDVLLSFDSKLSETFVSGHMCSNGGAFSVLLNEVKYWSIHSSSMVLEISSIIAHSILLRKSSQS